MVWGKKTLYFHVPLHDGTNSGAIFPPNPQMPQVGVGIESLTLGDHDLDALGQTPYQIYCLQVWKWKEEQLYMGAVILQPHKGILK